ncbi:regulation of exit from mitosis [Mactra antiquata]
MEIQTPNKNVKSASVLFDGGLQSSVRSQLIIELLKYVLYERQQIPQPFDQVKRDVALKAEKSAEMKILKLGRSCMKKAGDCVNKLEQIIENLNQAFHICPEIKQAVISIGATIVSPKEIYVIHLPPLNPDADNLSGKSCIKSLFRQLIMQDPLCDVKQISPTNITLLLSAPRNSNLSWFYPKASYKFPVRGRHFEFHLHSNCGQGRHDLSSNHSAVELSGFNPFDSIIEEDDNTSTEVDSPMSEHSVSADYVCIDSDHDMEVIHSFDVDDTSVCSSSANTSATGEQNHSDRKRMKKFDSKSSILSRSSVLGSNTSGVSNRSMESEHDRDTGIFTVSDSDYIWFKSPLVLKGYRNK